MGLGAIAGLAGGRLLGLLVNRLRLAEGLYPLLVLSGGLSVFAVTNAAGGSGFLAIYLAGVVAGNRHMHGGQNILRVHDGLAWLAQIVMFLVLGLLVTPSELVGDGPAGLAIAAVLMLVARPLAVVVSLLPFRFPWREQAFISWVGLRGAVPIILALFPLLAGLPRAALYFDVAFFVVLVSLVAQGWTIAPAARRLRLEVPPEPAPVQRVEVDGSRTESLEFVSFRAAEDSPVLDGAPSAAPLGEGAWLLGWLRDGTFCAPGPGERLAAGDVALLLTRQDRVESLARAFSGATGDARPSRERFFGAFALEGSVSMGDLEAAYGLPVEPGDRALAVGAYIARRVGARAVPGDAVRVGDVELVVRAVRDGDIVEVGLRLPG
jgi:cell volume regulation protein A